MFRETVTYTDYDGNTRTEDFYFNLTEAEVAEMEMSASGGYRNMLNRAIQEKNPTELIGIFKQFLLNSYGEKSPDGKYFYKTPEIRAKFVSTKAYSDLFMRLGSDSDFASKFINGIMPEIPPEARAEVEKQINELPQ